MSKITLSALTMAALFTLAACSDKNDTSVTLSASEAAQAEAPTSPAAQTLTTSDGKLSITTQGVFSDQSTKAQEWVSNGDTSKIVLLQRDDSQDITLSVVNLGAPKSKANDYFKQLSEALKQNSALQNVQVGVATENRMNYQFSHSQDGTTLNEHCLAVYEPENLYAICASSDTVQPAQLADTLKEIKLNP